MSKEEKKSCTYHLPVKIKTMLEEIAEHRCSSSTQVIVDMTLSEHETMLWKQREQLQLKNEIKKERKKLDDNN